MRSTTVHVILAAALFVLPSAPLAAGSSANLVVNPGFEAGLAGWVVNAPAGACPVALGAPAATVVGSGVFNLRIEDPSNVTSCHVEQYVRAVAGHVYVLCAEMAAVGGSVWLYMDFRDGSIVRFGHGLGFRTGVVLASTSGQDRVCVTGVAPSGTSWIRVLFTTEVQATGTSYVDEVVLTDRSVGLEAWAIDAPSATDVTFERDETGRDQLDALGQRTCIPEVLAATETAACRFVEGGDAVSRTLVLEARETGARTRAAAGLHEGRSFLLAGPALFTAHFGLWNDLDTDGILEGDGHDGPEFVGRQGALFAFVEPGRHPSVAQSSSFGPEPDFAYRPVGKGPLSHFVAEGGPLVFYDGSLLQAYVVETVGYDRAVAHPSDGEPDRRDVDVYAAVAPRPVAALYRDLVAPVVNEVASPSL